MIPNPMENDYWRTRTLAEADLIRIWQSPEYCLIAAAIGLAVVGAVNLLGSRSAKKPVAYGFVLAGRGPLRRSDLIATVAKFTLRVPERAHNLLQ